MRHLILRLEAPLVAFGGETIDNYGVIRRFPSASMLTGLLANALGWRRTEAERLQGLQERLVFGARIDREPANGVRMRDFQTVWLGPNDRGWTTRGRPEGRGGGTSTYNAPHLRYRDYFADMRISVALRLEPEDGFPTMKDLETALQEPARPLFIGRKPCLPSCRIFEDVVEADTVLAALLKWPPEEGSGNAPHFRSQWPDEEGVEGIEPSNRRMITDQRNWVSGLHGGGRWVCEGEVESRQIEANQSQPAGEEEGES